MNTSRLLVAVISVLGLSACTRPGISLVTSDESAIFTLDEYHHEASKGDILVIVRGGLPGVSQPALENYVVAQMQGADWSPHAHFTATSGPNVTKMFSYVMMFNGPEDVTAAALCVEPTQPHSVKQPARPGDVTLVAGLCRYNEDMLGVTGRVSGVGDLNDIKLHRLIVDAVHELTRPRRTNPFGNTESGGTDHNP